MRKRTIAIFLLLATLMLVGCGGESNSCWVCNGSGYNQKKTCPACNGTGRLN